MSGLSRNEITEKFFAADRFAQKEKEIAQEVLKKTGFIPQSVLWRSTFFGAKLGAFHYAGQFEDKQAVLKVQGVKPETSEAEMITAFQTHNRSKVIRPPLLYLHLPWDEQAGYEVLVMEHAQGRKVVSSGQLSQEADLDHFFQLYQEYRRNCASHPWMDIPQGNFDLASRYEKLRQIARELHPYPNPLSFSSDPQLVDQALEIVQDLWNKAGWVFCNRHVSVEDLVELPTGEVVLLSNLYWSYMPPLYDAVFGYHWFMLSLERKGDLKMEEIETERQKWLAQILALPETKGYDNGEVLVKAALLERACATLTVDGFVPDYRRHSTQHLVSSTRKFLTALVEDLGKVA